MPVRSQSYGIHVHHSPNLTIRGPIDVTQKWSLCSFRFRSYLPNGLQYTSEFYRFDCPLLAAIAHLNTVWSGMNIFRV